MHWRWQEDSEPGTPWDNMALDEAFFEELRDVPDTLPLVRVYHWDRPSVSVGRLQDEKAVQRAFPGLPTVRRPTGGLAVLHGADVTVCVFARVSDLPAATANGVLSSYTKIVGGILEAFTLTGIPACLGGADRRAVRETAIDCFTFAARCDVVETVTGRKLAGCAQRRQNDVILQQMSIPLANMSDEAEFIQCVKSGLSHALRVTEWVSVDSADSV